MVEEGGGVISSLDLELKSGIKQKLTNKRGYLELFFNLSFGVKVSLKNCSIKMAF